MKHGKGKYYWPDGSCYNGEWSENKINGKVFIIGQGYRESIHGLMEESTMEDGRIIA